AGWRRRPSSTAAETCCCCAGPRRRRRAPAATPMPGPMPARPAGRSRAHPRRRARRIRRAMQRPPRGARHEPPRPPLAASGHGAGGAAAGAAAAAGAGPGPAPPPAGPGRIRAGRPAGSAGRCSGRHGAHAMHRRGRLWLLPVTVLVALLLALLPLPAPVQGLRPYWLALVVAYWVIEEPGHAGLGCAFTSGVVADLVTGSLLGEHALRLVVMAFILQRFRAQLRFFPLGQQALAIGGLLLNDRVVAAALHLLLGLPQLPWP